MKGENDPQEVDHLERGNLSKHPTLLQVYGPSRREASRNAGVCTSSLLTGKLLMLASCIVLVVLAIIQGTNNGLDSWPNGTWRWLTLGAIFVGSYAITSYSLGSVVLATRRQYPRNSGLIEEHSDTIAMAASLGATLAGWVGLFLGGRGGLTQKEAAWVARGLAILVVIALTRAVGRLFVSAVSTRLHRVAFLQRIQEALLSELCLKSLAGEPFRGEWHLPNGQMTSEAERYLVASASGMPMRVDQLLGNFSQVAVSLTDDKVHRMGKHVFKHDLTGTLGHGSGRQIGSALYKNVVRRKSPSKGCCIEDFEKFLPPALAKDMFAAFDTSGVGIAYEAEFARVVERMLRDRKRLAATLGDAKSAVDKLDLVVFIALTVVDIVVILLILGADILSLWVSFSSIVLAGAFVFGGVLQTLFNSVVLLFFVHPFDVGDAITIDDGPYMSVLELGLHTTVLQQADGHIVYYDNGKLTKSRIVNISRSQPLWLGVSAIMDYGVTPKQVSRIEQELKHLAASDPGNFSSPDSVYMYISTTNDPLKVQLQAWFELADNGAALGKKNRALGRMNMRLQQALITQGIQYSDPYGGLQAEDTPDKESKVFLRPNNWAYEGARYPSTYPGERKSPASG